MLNTDLNIFLNALAANCVCSKQIHIGEEGRLISDILDISDKLNVDGCLVTVNNKKAFVSLDHGFLLLVFKKISFGNDFIDWIKILLANQKSCAINGGSTTPYFKLEKGPCQGDTTGK